MKRIPLLLTICLMALITQAQESDYPADYAKAPRFRALFCYDPGAESAHVEFDKQALQFFHKLSYGEGYLYDVCTTLDSISEEKLKTYDLLVMLNALPSRASRAKFERYMEEGGGWIGFHASAFNNEQTNWPWFNQFLGCGPFYCNNWPPQAALVECDTNTHTVTRNLPHEFVIPASEYYQWNPSPRLAPHVEVLLSLSPRNYPLGIKDIVRHGDFPIVWTNTRYRMIYLNMGHGDECFTDATQNLLFTNAFSWISGCQNQKQ